MEFSEINNFIVNHASEQHYAADLTLYKTTFPNSRLIPQLEQPFVLNKHAFDERMLLEMMNAGVSIKQIEASRAGKTPAAKKEVQTNDPDADTLDLLQRANIQDLNYNECKKLVFALKLQPESQKADILKSALIAEQTARFGQKKS